MLNFFITTNLIVSIIIVVSEVTVINLDSVLCRFVAKKSLTSCTTKERYLFY